MHFSPLHYFPLSGPFFLVLLIIFAVLFFLVQLGAIEYAYAKMGISRRWVFTILLLSLGGSYVNIPVAEFQEKEVASNQIVTYYGVQYVVPAVQDWPRTIVAVNVGGALIPTILSIYLLAKNRLFWQSLVGILVVACIAYMIARPVKGLGIAMPPLIPPIAAAVIAFAISRKSAPALAYISGSMGTLIGADIMNLGIVQGLGAPVLSIGGAGTFDGVFLSGVLAVLLA